MYTLPIEALLDRVGMEPHHVEQIKKIEDVMTPLAHEMALGFYDYLGRDPRSRALLWSEPGRVERLYGAFEVWYREMFAGVYDEEYAEKRWRIGIVHARYGVTTSAMIPAIGYIHTLALEHLLSALRPVELPEVLEALTKVLALETTLMAESYEVATAMGLGAGVDWKKAPQRGAEIILAESTSRLTFVRGR